jgi:hypothetical protein
MTEKALHAIDTAKKNVAQIGESFVEGVHKITRTKSPKK